MRVDAGGRFVVTGMSEPRLRRPHSPLALQTERDCPFRPGAGAAAHRLYQPWNASIDAGWTQWLLGKLRFRSFSAVRPADVKAGGIKQRFDVLILADGNTRSILDDSKRDRCRRRFEGEDWRRRRLKLIDQSSSGRVARSSA